VNKFFKITILLFFVILLQACQTATKKTESVHGDKPLIDIKKIIIDGRKDMDKKVSDGPKPYDTEFSTRPDKRKVITTETIKNYVSISDEYTNLKQNISINFQSMDFRYVMSLMADIGDINILVGDEVSGTVNAKIDNISWDIAFQTLLDMKTLVADIDVVNGIIRIHSPENLTAQETAKSARAEVLKKKIALEDSVEPILAEIFRLYYISPTQAKATLEALFASQSSEGVNTMSNLSITVENTTRSIIVRGHETDLDTIDAVIREIDVKTKQVLIEAFIVDASSSFARELGAKLNLMTKDDKEPFIPSAATSAASTAAIGAITGNVTTSGLGVISGIAVRSLKIQLEALESLGLSKTLSQPSVFTLNNQEATITQGTQIAYQTTADGTTTTAFKEAALSLTVTPSIIGDGNVLLDIKVNNDSPVEVAGSDEPGIKTNSIVTKLLVSDGEIVVIGGIKKNTMSNVDKKSVGAGELRIIGNASKDKDISDELVELLIFIAPRVID